MAILSTVYICTDHGESVTMKWNEEAQDHICPVCGKTATLPKDSILTIECITSMRGRGVNAVEVKMGTAQ